MARSSPAHLSPTQPGSTTGLVWAWVGLGNLKSPDSGFGPGLDVCFLDCRATSYSCQIWMWWQCLKSVTCAYHFIGLVLDLFLDVLWLPACRLRYLNNSTIPIWSYFPPLPYQSCGTTSPADHNWSVTRSISRHPCRISEIFTQLHHLNSKSKSISLSSFHSVYI